MAELECDGGCSYGDGPQEECSAHGRTPRDLWGIIGQLVVERDAATAAIERVRAIHVRDEYGLCAECSWEYPETSYDALSNDVAWPCPTIAALDGAPEPEVKP